MKKAGISQMDIVFLFFYFPLKSLFVLNHMTLEYAPKFRNKK